MLNNNYVVKEFYDLNGYYLKVCLFNEDKRIICYNERRLDGIKYETQITSEEVFRKSQSKYFSTSNLFELIIKKICENKYIIKSDQLIFSILLLETSNAFNLNKDIKLIIPKNKGHVSTEYENILMKKISKLLEENKKLSDENSELKNLLKRNNHQINNNNIIDEQSKEIYTIISIINQKDTEINELKLQLKNISNFNNTPNNNININEMLTVNFISSDQNIHFAVPCIGKNTFAEIEEKLYQQYPEYRETNNNFLANGTQVLRFKTIAENKIGNGLPVTLIVPS